MRFLLLALIISTTTLRAGSVSGAPSSKNSDGCFHCGADITSTKPGGDGELQALRSIANALSPEVDFGILAERICYMYLKPGDKAAKVKHTIVDFLEDNLNIKDPSKKEIISVLNKHKNELTCDDKHFMSYAIKRGLYNEIFYFLFFDENDLYSEEYKLDFNAITKTYNPKTKEYELMTVLDYIEKVALVEKEAKSTRRELNEMKEDIIDLFGAKRYEELSKKEKAEAKQLIARREQERSQG